MAADPKRMRMRGYIRAGQTFPDFVGDVRADLIGHGVPAGFADHLVKRHAESLRSDHRRGIPAEVVGPDLFCEACRLVDEGDPDALFLTALGGGLTH